MREPQGRAHSNSFFQRFLTACDRERILHSLARHIPGATFQFYQRVDRTEGFHYLSPRAVLLFGSFRNWRSGRFVHPDDRQRLVESVDHAINTFSPWSFEGRYVLRSGETRWFLGLAGPTRRGDELVFNGVLLDIHARKCAEIARDQAVERERVAREEAEAANRAKDRFMAIVSHELRAPLTPILITAALLEQDASLPDAVRKDLRTIRENVELQSRLVADLVDCASIQAGKLRVLRTQTSVHTALEKAITTSRPGADRKGVRILLARGAKADLLLGDADRLCQIFRNSLLNAVRLSAEGGCVQVRTIDDAGHVCVEISDHGTQRTQTLSRKSQPFARVPPHLNVKARSLGLGMAIAQMLVQAHDGSLSASSQVLGKGFMFVIRLPTLGGKAPVS